MTTVSFFPLIHPSFIEGYDQSTTSYQKIMDGEFFSFKNSVNEVLFLHSHLTLFRRSH